MRDAFFGVRRFGDFVAHLDIPRAVLAARLKALVAEGVLARAPGGSGRDEYELTEKGTKLWPIVRDLMAWGDEFYAPAGALRILRHAADDGVLDRQGAARACGETVPVAEIDDGAGARVRACRPARGRGLQRQSRQPRRTARIRSHLEGSF